MWHNYPQTIYDSFSSVARGEQMQLTIPVPFGNDCYMTNYPNSHFTRERAQPYVAEKPTFWWLKQKEAYLLTSQEVQHGQSRGKAVAQQCCSSTCSTSSVLAFIFMLVTSWLSTRACRLPSPSQASGWHSRWKGVYKEEREWSSFSNTTKDKRKYLQPRFSASQNSQILNKFPSTHSWQHPVSLK